MANARVRSVDGLPLASQLDGSEVLIASQQGAAVAVTAQKLAAKAASLVPPTAITNATVTSFMSAWLNSLPTTWEGVPVGDWWNNGGAPTRVTG